MSSEPVSEFRIEIEQESGYQFRVRFDKEQYADLTMDEPEPLGRDSAPSASRILAAAVGNCLSASLLFCAQKARAQIGPIRTSVHVKVGRNERGRLRIAGIEVEIDPQLRDDERARALRCMDLFEDYCTVTASIREGVPVEVTVKGFDK